MRSLNAAARSSGVQSEGRRPERHRPSDGPGQGDGGRVRVVVGLEHDHLVARFAQAEDRGCDRLGRSSGDQNLPVRVQVESVPVPLVVGHGVPQRRDAPAGRVLVGPAADCRDSAVESVGAVGVGEALAQVDRSGRQRQCRHLREDRGAELPHPPHACHVLAAGLVAGLVAGLAAGHAAGSRGRPCPQAATVREQCRGGRIMAARPAPVGRIRVPAHRRQATGRTPGPDPSGGERREHQAVIHGG